MTALALSVARVPRPWLDKKGRFHGMRATVFALLLLPGLAVAVRWEADALGAEPAKAALKQMGFWATWILLASLAVSPAKAVLGLPNLVVVRRMVGLGALAYALLCHQALVVADIVAIERSPALGLPGSYGYWAIAAGCALVALGTVTVALRVALLGPEALPQPAPEEIPT